jgi:drug/metabolite transporter (DMT)-like permease
MTSAAQLNALLLGAAAMACIVIGLFFVRYWRATGDRFFAFFVAAFWAFAAHWIGLAIVQPQVEGRHWLYVVRLLSFVLIIAGILDKNRRANSDAP